MELGLRQPPPPLDAPQPPQRQAPVPASPSPFVPLPAAFASFDSPAQRGSDM
jgi:hypothetical protein